MSRRFGKFAEQWLLATYINQNHQLNFSFLYGWFCSFTKPSHYCMSINFNGIRVFCNYAMPRKYKTQFLDLNPQKINLQQFKSSTSTTFIVYNCGIYTVLCMPCSSIIKGQFIPCLKQLVQDGDVDVQYFASEALSIINVSVCVRACVIICVYCTCIMCVCDYVCICASVYAFVCVHEYVCT